MTTAPTLGLLIETIAQPADMISRIPNKPVTAVVCVLVMRWSDDNVNKCVIACQLESSPLTHGPASISLAFKLRFIDAVDQFFALGTTIEGQTSCRPF